MVINILLVLAGIIMFFYSLYRQILLLGLVKGMPLRKWWVVLLCLILFFLGGYFAFAYWLISGEKFASMEVLHTLISMVFFAGAIFVVLTISLIYSTLQELIKKRSETKRLEEEKTAIFESKKAELQKKLKELEEANKAVQEAKLAMLNLLDDEKALEEELKQEKESVERKVIARTYELNEEQARLLASIKGLSLGFIMIDNQNKVILHNPAVEKVLELPQDGWDFAEVRKRFGSSFDFLGHCQTCVREKKSIDIKDVPYDSKFLRVFLAPVIMIRDAEEVIGVVILIEDITEVKILERSREEFFSIASHELRTPLTAIRGNTALIQQFYADKLKDGELEEMIADIHDSSTRLIKIVNDFLEVSRLELGRIEYKKEIFDLVPLIENISKELEPVASEKKLYLKFEKPEISLPSVFADKDRTKQILTNLIGNSLKFTKEGGVTISVSQEKDFLKISITDTGMGISKENQELLFRKFQQAGESIFTRDVTRGTGLGLYISKLIVEGLGGKIYLESSKVGKGSTFAFTLPASPPGGPLAKSEKRVL